jgi:hypothetical protein
MSFREPMVLPHNKNVFRRIILPGVILVIGMVMIVLGGLWLRNRLATPREAPEAAAVLQAQQEMPFQVLIPAYLPKSIVREKVQVITDQVGPSGQAMIQLVYPTRRGENLTFYEWLPTEQEIQQTSTAGSCSCMSQVTVTPTEAGEKGDSLRVRAVASAPTVLNSDEARTVLDTLGPAMNQQIFTSLKEVPLAYALPPAVDVPINEAGIQEITLVVTPSGYSPPHFAVKTDVPVVLTFRQLGQVGCGNELIFQWEKNETATLYLPFPTDVKTLEFTPGEAGEFRFYCPHDIYRGVMTVLD